MGTREPVETQSAMVNTSESKKDSEETSRYRAGRASTRRAPTSLSRDVGDREKRFVFAVVPIVHVFGRLFFPMAQSRCRLKSREFAK